MMTNSIRIKFAVLKFILTAGTLLLLVGCADQQSNPDSNEAGGQAPTHIPTRKPAAATLTPRPSPDMNGETFVIYVIASNQEPFTQVNEVLRKGLEDYLAYQNSHGGVNGAALEMEFSAVDEGDDRFLSAFQAAAEQDDVLVILMLAPVDQELYALINEQEVPVIYFGLGAESIELKSDEDHLFWVVPTPDQQLGFWLEYALENWVTLRPEGQFDVMRLSHIGWEASEPDPVRTAALRTLVEDKNIVFASQGGLPRTANPSAANPILDGVFNQSTMIYMDLYSYGPASVVSDLSYLDLEGMFNLAGGSWSLGINFEEFLPGIELETTVYTLLPVAWWSEVDNPGIQQAEEIFLAAGREAHEKELAYLYALAGLDLAVAAMEDALFAQQGAINVELTPEALYQALSEMEDYLVLGGLYQVGFSSGLRGPSEMRIWKYLAGEDLEVESDYIPLIEND
ncbi:MAG: ABC transporter substrate-binding protein [Chloroflexota bacterium]